MLDFIELNFALFTTDVRTRTLQQIPHEQGSRIVTSYGIEQISYLMNHDAVWSLPGRDGEPLSVACEGIHDCFLCGLTCECGQSVCPYTAYGCSCQFGTD